jgi:hypothetical protein
VPFVAILVFAFHTSPGASACAGRSPERRPRTRACSRSEPCWRASWAPPARRCC